MKQTKKIIAIGLSLGMVLTSIPVSASDYITADQWSEDVEGISESSEGCGYQTKPCQYHEDHDSDPDL